MEIRRPPKHQAPNTKLQRSSKSQAPNQGPSEVVAIQGGALRFGAWNFSGAWSLGFETSQPSHSTENSEEPFFRSSSSAESSLLGAGVFWKQFSPCPAYIAPTSALRSGARLPRVFVPPIDPPHVI